MADYQNMVEQHCGYVAVLGRPNVGKSTLINAILGQKLSIVSHKPQTTRHRIMGIHSTDEGQIVFLDTPGIHMDTKLAINRYMNRAATAVMHDVELVLFLVDSSVWTAEDEHVLGLLKQSAVPVICVINKMDKLNSTHDLLPLTAKMAEKHDFMHIIAVSALKGKGLDELERLIMASLPFSQPFYDEEQLTDRSERFLVSEYIREQLFHRMHKEIPYHTAVEIEGFERDGQLVRIHAVIWVERDSQKKIVIGKGGKSLKDIGTAARKEMEKLLESKVFLQLWVKVRKGWSDDERALNQFGYRDE